MSPWQRIHAGSEGNVTPRPRLASPQNGLVLRTARAVLTIVVSGVTLGLTTAQIAGQRALGDPVQDRLFEQGVLRGPGAWLGVAVRNVTDAEAERWQLDRGGAVIERITSGGPAWRTALRVGDVITTFDGLAVRDAHDLSRLVRETPPGWSVMATAAREGVTWEIELTVELPSSPAPNAENTSPSDGQDELVSA